jgi:nickel-dependent lactate racemase
MQGMRTIRLAYGESGLDLGIDEDRFDPTVILPHDPQALADPHAAFRAAVESPSGAPALSTLVARRTRELGRPPRSLVVAISDHTRPVPDGDLIPWLVEHLGIADELVTILIGTGTHRGSTPLELERKLGKAVLARFRVVNHDCKDGAALVRLGSSSCGGECWLNRIYAEADLRIATGFIEPHFFAGFSGGSKAIVPGVAGLATIQHFHRAALIAHPRTTWGDIAGNPLQQLSREMVALCPPHFIINVTLNLSKRITGVFAGELLAAHDAGCAQAYREALSPVPRRYPVVVTTNSGFPLDQNFYQSVKGISAAARIVEQDGTIVIASRCDQGLPDDGEFRRLLADGRPSPELLAAILRSSSTPHDQWQVQTLLQCLQQARVILHSELSADERALTRTEHSDDLAATLDALAQRSGGSARVPIAILPMGPLTIPVVAAHAAAAR